MLSKETLNKLGVFGVAFGLLASPLTYADFHEEEEPQEEEQTLPDSSGNSETGNGAETTEYENEEQETETFEYEEEDEEEEWEETEEDDEEDTW
ncbi:MAG: hypothetical protein ACQEUM_14625 [Pseudomonadota bacterium]